MDLMTTSTLLNDILGFLVLSFLELVLGIDNLVFLAIMSNQLPEEERQRARRWGLTFAWLTRLLLLGLVFWLSSLTAPLFVINHFAVSLRDLVLIIGGLFLIYKATIAIQDEIEQVHAIKNTTAPAERPQTNFAWVVCQIGLLDIVFSFDSVITAVGMTNHFLIMAAAITVAILAMLLAADPLCRMIMAHPTLKMLALGFLILIGIMLVADGCHQNFPRGYIYFGIGFSLFIELLNHLVRRRKK